MARSGNNARIPAIGKYPQTTAPTFGTDLTDLADSVANLIGESNATASALPTTGNWPGRTILVTGTNLVYTWTGSAWIITGGETPHYHGKSAGAITTLIDGSYQSIIDTNVSTRQTSMSGGVVTFNIPGIYLVTNTVVWATANTTGQRNLGVLVTGGTILGHSESVMQPASLPHVSHQLSTAVRITAAGQTMRPYIAHNSGQPLQVHGHASMTWVSPS
jgi:hypothetical protein